MSMVKLHQKLPVEWHEREKLRKKGQFWTPNWVAEAMVAYVLDYAELVFDPATGRGAFFEALKKISLTRKITFFGTDIDADVLSDNIYNDPSCIVELRDFIKNPPKRKFRAIVANPPYLRHHRIDKETKQFLKYLCAKITGFVIDGRAGYHIYFLLQALTLLEDNGKLAFIMPADTCEGTFAKKLWNWITENYCLECVVTFDKDATPFPNVDTNAVVFLIKKDKPKKEIFWVKVNRAYSNDLFLFVSSHFKHTSLENLLVSKREIKEALATGLSRPQQNHNGFKYYLSDFATVMRGIATGANEFFFLTCKQVKELQIPSNYLRVAVGRTKDVTENMVTKEDVQKLEEKSRPTLLLSIDQPENDLPPKVTAYLKKGVELGLPERPLIKQRKPWFKMEKREVPELLFAYLGRRNTRFIKNVAGVLPLTGFLCVYPKSKDDKFVDSLWKILNHPDTLKNIQLVGKSYGSGAIKVEPRSLENLPIPEYIVDKYNLKKPYEYHEDQLGFIYEKRRRYRSRHRIKE